MVKAVIEQNIYDKLLLILLLNCTVILLCYHLRTYIIKVYKQSTTIYATFICCAGVAVG
jgi:hypothetical protein